MPIRETTIRQITWECDGCARPEVTVGPHSPIGWMTLAMDVRRRDGLNAAFRAVLCPDCCEAISLPPAVAEALLDALTREEPKPQPPKVYEPEPGPSLDDDPTLPLEAFEEEPPAVPLGRAE